METLPLITKYMEIHILYMYIEGRYIIYLYELWKRIEKRTFKEVLQRVQVQFY